MTAGQGSKKGRWTVRGTKEKGIITLVSSEGLRSSHEYSVHVEKGETYWNEYWINGKLYGRTR